MAIFYYGACVFGYFCALPFLLLACIFSAKYRATLPPRFFLCQKFPRDAEIWIHACSLGEINSLQGFLGEITSRKILLTAITNTGFSRARELFGGFSNIKIAYLPFEIFIPFFMPKTLKKLVVCEAELWFMLFFCAKKCGAKTLLLNARISSKSFPKYARFAWFYRALFSKIDRIFCQSEEDKVRLSSLGAQNIEVLGNIKALIAPKITRKISREVSAKIIVAASTHKGEEALILDAFLKNFASVKNCVLILAPRHPERFSEVWEMLKKRESKCAKFSVLTADSASNPLESSNPTPNPNTNPTPNLTAHRVILLDLLGELVNFYAIADCVILGGSFVEVGGHNPLECAHFGVRLISGAHIFNQHALFALVENYTLANAANLSEILRDFENLPKSAIKDSSSIKARILGEIRG